jgi:hypothetical protein
MPSRLLRILVLASALPLTLPSGWCCMLALSLGAGRNAPPAGQRPTPARCAGCCCTVPTTAAPGEPAPRPVPPRPGSCPCVERDATAPADFKAPAFDLCVTAPLAFAPAPAAPDVAAAVQPCPPPQLPPLHVLHCVWLC